MGALSRVRCLRPLPVLPHLVMLPLPPPPHVPPLPPQRQVAAIGAIMATIMATAMAKVRMNVSLLELGMATSAWTLGVSLIVPWVIALTLTAHVIQLIMSLCNSKIYVLQSGVIMAMPIWTPGVSVTVLWATVLTPIALVIRVPTFTGMTIVTLLVRGPAMPVWTLGVMITVLSVTVPKPTVPASILMSKTTKTSCHGKTFRIPGHSWGESTSGHWIPLTNSQ